jgi:hypothetical protein
MRLLKSYTKKYGKEDGTRLYKAEQKLGNAASYVRN